MSGAALLAINVYSYLPEQAVLAKFNPVYIDPARVLDTYDRWVSFYDDTLNGRATAR